MLSSDSRAKLKRSRGTTTIVARVGTSRRLLVAGIGTSRRVLDQLTIDKERRRAGLPQSEVDRDAVGADGEAGRGAALIDGESRVLRDRLAAELVRGVRARGPRDRAERKRQDSSLDVGHVVPRAARGTTPSRGTQPCVDRARASLTRRS